MSIPADHPAFEAAARSVLTLPIKYSINSLGGYGPNGEVIFEKTPFSCPSVLTLERENAIATLLTNGSVDFAVRHPGGLRVHVLKGSFDAVEKRETAPLSSNVWIALPGRSSSIINPNATWNLDARSSRVIKTILPRALWFCTSFSSEPGMVVDTVTSLTMLSTPHGHILQRNVYLCNSGEAPLCGDLWTYFSLNGTQRFAYHKPLWYDIGLPLSSTETITVARMPHEDILQIKLISRRINNLTACESTCDYSTFIGDSSAFSLFPQAIRHGGLLDHGARQKMNRFTTSSISASRFRFDLHPGESASLIESLLYLEDEDLISKFREQMTPKDPGYAALETALYKASHELMEAISDSTEDSDHPEEIFHPPFDVFIAAQPVISAYINSIWSDMDELYEKCRAHGAQLADGIEIGTRDRAQDMLSKMKADPARVRADLIHTLGFMYVTDDRPVRGQLTLAQKLHGLFPRQIPSRWYDRRISLQNDNRPYADSPLWLIDSLLAYLRETGDLSILNEQVETVKLLDPDHPETSGIIGVEKRIQVYEVVKEIFSAFLRHVDDSPYGLAQILYGDWCDPVDMFGTDIVGDAARRARGRGVQVRLSAHLCLCLVHAVDVFSAPNVLAVLDRDFVQTLDEWKTFANQLRRNIMRFGWEGPAGFIDCIHERKTDGARPDYAKGDLGYTLGSLHGRDFDGIPRRVLTTQAFGLEMLRLERSYLDVIPAKDSMIQSLLQQVDKYFYCPNVGLLLFSTPIPNTPEAARLVGRMGILPAGCAENGEYHHAQMFMHVFRLNIPGQADIVWEQFKPLLSVERDEAIGGPFDMTSNSYASDEADPHFGAGMYFGLSGSADWILALIQSMAGLRYSLHDDTQPDLQINPVLPLVFRSQFRFKTIIHQKVTDGYRAIPLTIRVERIGDGEQQTGEESFINGKPVQDRLIRDLNDYESIDVQILHYYERQP